MSRILISEIKQYFMAHISLEQTISILKMTDGVSSDVNKSLEKQKKHKKMFKEEFQVVRDNIDSIINNLTDVQKDVESHDGTLRNIQFRLSNNEKVLIRLEDKVDKIDDKFNLLTDFIDMMTSSKPKS
jgi:predicted nuclease with TOPRIM domain